MINHTEENSQFESHLFSVIRELKIAQLLRQANIRKSAGFDVFGIFQTLFVLAFFERSLFQILNQKASGNYCSKNTYYRFLNNDSFNWIKFLLLLSAKVTSFFNGLTDSSRCGLFVIDDSTLHRDRNKKAELLARTYDHVTHRFCKGFTLLTLGWTDGFSFVPVLFNLLSSAKKENRYNEISDKIDHRTNGYRFRQESMMRKPDAVILMLERALKFGVSAKYVLMDTWFTTAPLIERICQLGLHVIGMVKLGTQHYDYQGSDYTVRHLYNLARKHNRGDIISSICVKTGRGTPVKLVFVRNRSVKNRWLCILSSDVTITEEEIVRLYGNRWSIECFFKTTKSCLKLGKEYQNRNYMTAVASTAIVFTRYTILEWVRRHDNDVRTHGKLFLMMCDEVRNMTVSEALAQLLAVLLDAVSQFGEQISELLKETLSNWIESQSTFCGLLRPISEWES